MTDEPRNIDLDRAIGFTIPAQHARGRMVRVGPVLDAILSAHAYPAPIEALLAEALTLTALVGSTLKDAGGQLTLQTQTQGGVVSLLVCDYRGGEVRGYVQFDADKLADTPEDPSLFALFGKGYLAVTFDQASSGERYQGIVPLDGGTLSEAVESYFLQSEQIPTCIRIGMGKRGDRCMAGGLFLQHLPEGEDGRERLHTRLDHPEWDHVRALAETTSVEELADPSLPLETLAWRLFNEEERVNLLGETLLVRGCRCSADYIGSVVAKFSPEEQQEMADETGFIQVDCQFCSTKFPVRPAEVVA